MAKKKKTQDQDVATEAAEPTQTRLTGLLAGAAIQKINKKYGSTLLMRATDRRIQTPKRIPTGIFTLDLALGGGWPAGTINTLFGEKSAAKTTTILRGIAQAQRLCGNCLTGDFNTKTCECGDFRECVAAFIDVEGTLDLVWARLLGVDTDRLLLSVPEFAEQSLDIAEALIRSGEVDVIVLDSIAFLSPLQEIENSVEKDNMGVQARKIGQGIRKFVSALNYIENAKGWRPTFFFTNQIRMKLGVMFGNPETVSGGKAPGFVASVEVRVAQKKVEVDEKLQMPISAEMWFRVEKNKTAVPKGEGSYKMALTDIENKKLGDVMDEEEIVKTAENYGLLTGSGSVYYLFGEQYKGKAGLENKLMHDATFKAETTKMLLAAILNKPAAVVSQP